MTLTPDEERWLAQARRSSRRSVAGCVIFGLCSLLWLYDAFTSPLTHKLPDGSVVLAGGMRDLLYGFGFFYLALRSFYPSPSERLLVSLAERLRGRADAAPPNPALQQTGTGGDAGSAR